jgi:hypothetical protein
MGHMLVTGDRLVSSAVAQLHIATLLPQEHCSSDLVHNIRQAIDIGVGGGMVYGTFTERCLKIYWYPNYCICRHKWVE